MKPVVAEEREFESSNTDMNQSFGSFLNVGIIRLPMPGRQYNILSIKVLTIIRVFG